MKNLIQELFDTGKKLGHDWAYDKTDVGIVDLFNEKIEAGEVGWFTDRCRDILQEVYNEHHLLDGPWGNVTAIGFAAGILQTLQELSRLMEQQKSNQERICQKLKSLVDAIEKSNRLNK